MGGLKARSVAPFGPHPCLIDVEYVTHLTRTAGTRGIVIGRGYTADTIHFSLGNGELAPQFDEGGRTLDCRFVDDVRFPMVSGEGGKSTKQMACGEF